MEIFRMGLSRPAGLVRNNQTKKVSELQELTRKLALGKELTMIDDILKANPGMNDTYRAHARMMLIKSKLDELTRERARNSGLQELQVIDAKLAELKSSLEEVELEIIRCYENEDRLRAQRGMPPLPQEIKDQGTNRKKTAV
jgi:hypothetical protein